MISLECDFGENCHRKNHVTKIFKGEGGPTPRDFCNLILHLNADSFKGSLFLVIVRLNCT